ncbi:MAG TPA: TetR/AcrR family transcriptional regulator [Bacteroidales bacterium]|nr:TetR/AcrR family transcriptional regulator [Flavobacterium sp.]HZK08623.1 TetR/AcrR family transcriptional regulator [Bacteroidales bacterium]
MYKKTDFEMSDRQKEIIDVSLELIAEKGIQGLTIKNLAKKIGFSESATYRHYENKTQILIAVLDFFKDGTQQLFADQLNTEADAMVKIKHLFLNQFKFFTQSPSLVAVVFSEELFQNKKILSGKVSDIMNTNFRMMTQILQAGQNNGELRPDIEAPHLSLVVLGSLRLFVKQWHLSNHAFNLTEKGKELTNSIEILIRK